VVRIVAEAGRPRVEVLRLDADDREGGGGRACVVLCGGLGLAAVARAAAAL